MQVGDWAVGPTTTGSDSITHDRPFGTTHGTLSQTPGRSKNPIKPPSFVSQPLGRNPREGPPPDTELSQRLITMKTLVQSVDTLLTD